jgi:hypothetical protein
MVWFLTYTVDTRKTWRNPGGFVTKHELYG